MKFMIGKVFVFLVACVVVTVTVSCRAQTDGLENSMRRMESAEQRANERASQQLVAFMSFDTMFSDPQTRALAKAAGSGKTGDIRSLVEQGVDVNAQGNQGATALFWAMREGSVRGFTTLLELGADPNVIFGDGGTVMHWSVRNQNDAYLKAALEHGGNPNLKAGQFDKTPLFNALGEHRSRLDLLIAAGADVNAESIVGTPVFVAAGLGSFDVVYKLLQTGADYNYVRNGQKLVEVTDEVRARLRLGSDSRKWADQVIAWLIDRGEVL